MVFFTRIWVVLPLVLVPQLVLAAPCTVTTNADSGTGSLRAAITSLNSSTCDSNTIIINTGIGTITLASDLPLIQHAATIKNLTGAPNAVIDGANQYRLFATNQASLTVDGVTLTHGLAQGGAGANGNNFSGGGGGGLGAGGAIYVDVGQTLALSNTTISTNTAQGGSGASSTGNGDATIFGGGGGGASFSSSNNKNSPGIPGGGDHPGSGGTGGGAITGVSSGYGGGNGGSSSLGQAGGAGGGDGVGSAGNSGGIGGYAGGGGGGAGTGLHGGGGGNGGGNGAGIDSTQAGSGGGYGSGGAGGQTPDPGSDNSGAAGGGGGFGGGGGGGSGGTDNGGGGGGGFGAGGGGGGSYGPGQGGQGGSYGGAGLAGGTGGENPVGGSAGGGAGIGGGIFVADSATLVLGDNITIANNNVFGGGGGNGGGTLAPDLFLFQNATLKFNGNNDWTPTFVFQADTNAPVNHNTTHIIRAGQSGTGTISLTDANSNLSNSSTINVTTGGLALQTGVTLNGGTTVSGGSLAVGSGAQAGGTVNVSGGTLSGFGTVSSLGSALTVSGGTLHPGGSVGILTDAGNFAQTGGTLNLDILGQHNIAGTNNGEMVVAGTASVSNAPSVNINSEDGGYFVGGYYTIFTSNGLTGTYNAATTTHNNISGLPLTARPLLHYDAKNIYLDFQTPFLALPNNANQLRVAEQLTAISAPDSDEAGLLLRLTASPLDDLRYGLDQISGSQYASMLSSVELSMAKFLQRMYRPLQSMLSHRDKQADPVWIEFTQHRDFFKDGVEAHGFTSAGTDLSVGIQQNIDTKTVVGAALGHSAQHLHFNIGGAATSNTVIGSVYGAYSTNGYYTLANLMLSGSRINVNRFVAIGSPQYNSSSVGFYSAKGISTSLQGLMYTELGLDYKYNNLLLQPFMGLETGHYDFSEASEDASSPIALNVRKKKYDTFVNHIGAHISTTDELVGFFVSLDLTMKNRINPTNDHRALDFEGFGRDFIVQGLGLKRHSFNGAMTLKKQLNAYWSGYAGATGMIWGGIASYEGMIGFSSTW